MTRHGGRLGHNPAPTVNASDNELSEIAQEVFNLVMNRQEERFGLSPRSILSDPASDKERDRALWTADVWRAIGEQANGETAYYGRAARRQGASWALIGRALGVTKQAAQSRLGR